MKLKDLTKENLPREKASVYGIETLSDAELLALILERGIKGKNVIELSNEILNLSGGISGLIYENYSSLEGIKGLNEASIFKLLGVIEIFSRLGYLDPSKEYFDNNSLGRRYFKKLMKQEKEFFYLIHLNQNKKIIKEELLNIGSIKNVLLNEKGIENALSLTKCSSFVLIHNHPFGSCKPSKDDIDATDYIRKKFDSLGYNILDHIIVSNNGFYSFANNGLLKKRYKN